MRHKKQLIEAAQKDGSMTARIKELMALYGIIDIKMRRKTMC